MRRLLIACAAALLFALDVAPMQSARAQSPQGTMPDFLPSWFAPAFTAAGKPMRLVGSESRERNAVLRYASQDGLVWLEFTWLRCEPSICPAVFDNVKAWANQRATERGGRFLDVTAERARAEFPGKPTGAESIFIFRMPASVGAWNMGGPRAEMLGADACYETLRALADRFRLTEAATIGNVEAARWVPSIRAHAERLLKESKRDEALATLRQAIQLMPMDFDSHLLLARTTPNQTEARASARAVLDNAEDETLIAGASALLAIAPDSTALPALGNGPLAREWAGLQVILVPLPPYDLRLLRDTAAIFEKMTDIPVRLAAYPGTWSWGSPERMPQQRTIEQYLARMIGPAANFAGWDRQRFIKTLTDSTAGKDALTRFTTATFIDGLATQDGQFDAAPALRRFLAAATPLGPADKRALYIGVTAANIYAGDVNYLFSAWEDFGSVRGSLLSYAMMQAKNAGDEWQSRKRLSERLAKEMVPAALKSLGIPRPADPSDPHSFSNGVQRLNEKSLVLSPPTRDALSGFR